MADPFLRTDRLRMTYRSGAEAVRAVQDVSLHVEAGAFVSVMGPSGSGKSTLLHLLGCLEPPTAGRYFFDGREVSTLDPDALANLRNQRIGFVFQTFNLLSRTSAAEQVALPLLYTGLRGRERRRRAHAMLDAVGLADRARHWPSQLSGGQQQRVAIARALINSPSLILADEPTGALETRTGLEVLGMLQGLNRRGMTVVLVTHDPDVAHHAGRILHMRDGRIIGDEAVERPLRAAKALRALSAAGPAPGPGVEARP